MLDHNTLLEELRYEENTGLFWWKKPKRGRRLSHPAGNIGPRGYRRIQMFPNKMYYAHRLAWLYVHGSWPTEHIDHINGDSSDNRICNLRDICHQQNVWNSKTPKNNTSGYKGVCFVASKNKWLAKACKNRIQYNLGYFSTAEEAYHVYCKKLKELHGTFANLG